MSVNETSSCCAPDGTCSSQKEEKVSKPVDHFFTKLRVEHREKIVSTLDSTQDIAEIKATLLPELPKYFLKKLLKFIEAHSVNEALAKLSVSK